MIEKEQELQETVIQGPGQILKQAREKANLSCQDIADKMKLKKSLIDDIERDNYDINISLTFVRGYLKLYAKHVYVSEEEIIAAFEGLSTQKKESVKLQSFSRRVANQANDDKLMLVTYLIVAAVIALVVVWWLQQSSTDTTTASNTSNYPEVVSQDLVAPEIIPLEETLSTDVQTLISTPIVVRNASTDNAAIIPSDAQFSDVIEQLAVDNQSIAAEVVDDTNNVSIVADIVETTTVAETAAPVELIFEFADDCWVELIDATGEKIAFGVKVKGRVMPVTGIPPFAVKLGAPEVVKISYAGEPLDMSFLPAGRIAKFDLPRSE